MTINERQYQQLLVGHGIFTIFGVLLLITQIPPGIGFLIIVMLYNVIVPIWSKLNKWNEIFDVWLFSFLLSILQVIPDWILVDLLQVLVFPEDGLFKIGPVAGYMWGLWSIAFVPIISTGLYLFEKYKQITAPIIGTTIVSLLIFGMSEMSLWRLGSWFAQDVEMTFHIAHYILIPEIILGVTTFLGYFLSKDRSWSIKIPVIISIMIFYVGLIVTSYFFFELI